MTQIFLTGVTGFVGKVVLEELIRRRGEIGFEKVFVLIRPGRKGETPQGRFDKEVKAQEVGELVMENLHNLDEVAYVRFASVYRQFKDINQFMKELKGLLNKKEE